MFVISTRIFLLVEQMITGKEDAANNYARGHYTIGKEIVDLVGAIGRALIGMIVITKYNNKTYTIDDINWDLNPEKTFPDRVCKACPNF